ncbi:MAG: class I SAM-dependent methyltransferase [Nitrospinae bacterium]|nr:class I SAM-dependent methyltransferase [Nitrospinota bacterium]
MSLLNYYTACGISPVHYLASSVQEHLERRQSLYDMLGLPGLMFRGAKVLEIAAGSGQNSLYVSMQLPSKYVIIEPNPAALKQIEGTYADFNFPHTRPEVLPVTLEEYGSGGKFDVVICENWLGASDHERSLAGTIADLVAPGGAMVLTALSIAGWLPNLIRYGLVQKMSAGKPDDYQTRVAMALEAFSPHLRTIAGMTRRHEDWVKDNMVNPTYLVQGLTLEMILQEAAPKGFTVFGSSPGFITEWRWFKQLTGEGKKKNENALECYERLTHNFLDYRRTFPERDAGLNAQLSGLAAALLSALAGIDAMGRAEVPSAKYDEIIILLRRIKDNVNTVSGEMGAAIDEAIRALDSPEVTPSALSEMENFKHWFGRETLYFSLIRSNAVPDSPHEG